MSDLFFDQPEASSLVRGRRLRLLHLHSSADVGGTELSTIELVRNLDAGRFEQFAAFLSPAGPISRAYQDAGFETIIMREEGLAKPYFWRVGADLVRLCQILRKGRFDLALLYGMTGNALGRIASVFSPHTAVVGIIRGLTNHAHVSPLRMWVDRATMPLVDRYISNSRFVMEELRRWRFPEKKLCVCHTGIDPRPFLEASAREEARAALHLSTEGLVVLCVASLRPVKNHPFLLDVCERLWRRGSRFTLLLAGTGPDEKKLRERAGKSDWSDRIRFLGLFDEVPMLLAASDIFVLASHSEGLPRSIMERPKKGFGVPLASWFRGELREMACDLLTDTTFSSRGYFHVDFVRRMLDEHIAGTHDWHYQLWNLLILELWHRGYVDRKPSCIPS